MKYFESNFYFIWYYFVYSFIFCILMILNSFYLPLKILMTFWMIFLNVFLITMADILNDRDASLNEIHS